MKRNVYLSIVAGLLTILLFAMWDGCQKSHSSQPTTMFLMMSQAQFEWVNGNPKPGVARLVLVYPSSSGKMWETEVIEDNDSNVFHKALVFKPERQSPGILTIGANRAMLKLWRRQNGKNWLAETLWSPEFGGEQNRLRDVEVGDVTGDGRLEIVIATHDQGVIAVLQQTPSGWNATELNRAPSTYVHEIEIGDVDGDGKNEIFATPSAPNRTDVTIHRGIARMHAPAQPGTILMYRYVNGEFVRSIVDEFPTRHVKEILVAAVQGEGHPDLYASIEGDISGRNKGDAVKIKRYQWSTETVRSTEIGTLMDPLCRFLTVGDVNNDGRLELIASPFKSGVWMFTPTEAVWKKQQISSESSGVEHATVIADLDGDGSEEIYVAADDQRELQKLSWDGSKFRKDVVYKFEGDKITFGLVAGSL